MKKKLDAEQLEYRRWLVAIERRTILPIKWVILLASVLLWQCCHSWQTLPPTEVFATFFIYGLCNIAIAYFVTFSHLAPNQIKPLCFGSYLVDLAYVTALILLDSMFYAEEAMRGDFYVFYFLLILRGFTLFEQQREGVVFHLLILVLYTFSTWFGTRGFEFLLDRRFILNLFLIWMVILMSWYIMEIIRKQHGDLARIRENLVRSESLAIVGEMAASVAHEINNPVGIILAYSEFMLRQSKAGDPQRADLQILADEAKRCKSIVSELLDFSRASHPTVSQPADMCVLNDEVLRFVFHDRSNRNIRIIKNYEEAPPVNIDPVQMKQALVNVYLNAKQALENAGDIEVSIRATDPTQKRVSLRIANGGDPIRDEVIDRAFEPFYTSKERGTGLGLSITHRIVEAHQGDIQIGRNANQEGAYVEITLPALAPRTTA